MTGSGFDTVLVANRGAIARRVVRACRNLGLKSVVVFSEADAGAPYLDEADAAFALSGTHARDTYLNQDALLDIARWSGAQAVHPGYGFLAENANFAAAVRAAGLQFVGPDVCWLRDFGDKSTARGYFAQRGFPVLRGSEGLATNAEIAAAAGQIGFPLLVKASAGGGGMGMQRVDDTAGLFSAVAGVRSVASQAFGDERIFLEQWVERARHIEFQIIGDGLDIGHAYERECSVQRRHQKLVEESPAVNVDRSTVDDVAELAAAASAGYDSVGTLECLLTPDGEFGFLEFNTRIQVEHGVTEAVTGLDLVGMQLQIARGGQTGLGARPSRRGHAIEARVYAEDPRTLQPSTGRLAAFVPPQLTGVRIETGYREGQLVTPFYDALLAKVIALGDTREQAIGRLLVALKAFTIHGVATNQPLLQRILEHDHFLAGRVHTRFVEQQLV